MGGWEATILGPRASMEDAINVLEQVGLRIVLVADDEGRLLGTITDGDIRRALIRNQDMRTKLSNIMFKESTTALLSDERESILRIMKSNDVMQVPLLDREGRIVGLETINEVLDRAEYDNPVLLLAGGFGKRLRPMTENTPKPLLKVGDKPLLERTLLRFVSMGFKNFYISTHYKAEMFEDRFGDGSKWGVSIAYLVEDKPLGTAGPLGRIPKGLDDLPTIISNGDLLTTIDYVSLLEFHYKHASDLTTCVRRHEIEIPYGVVDIDNGRVVAIREKPIHSCFVSAGVYVINPDVIAAVSGTEYLDMPDFLQAKIEEGRRLNIFPVHEYWLDIGRHQEFDRAQQDVRTLKFD